MGKGYGDGPAAEELLADPGESARRHALRRAVMGSTDDDPRPHFIGWADEVDADALFESGQAWGLSVVARPSD